MPTQILEVQVETVSWQGSYPELSGYGNREKFRVVMEDGDRKTAVIYIRGQPYFHAQLQDFLNEAAAFIENNTQ